MRRASKPSGSGSKKLKHGCGQTNIVVTSSTPDSLTVDWKDGLNSGARVTEIASGAGLCCPVLSFLRAFGAECHRVTALCGLGDLGCHVLSMQIPAMASGSQPLLLRTLELHMGSGRGMLHRGRRRWPGSVARARTGGARFAPSKARMS